MYRIFLLCIIISFLFVTTGCVTDDGGPRYRDVRSYSEGLAPAQSENGRWGYINEKQIWVIYPRFEEVRDFEDRKAAVKLNGRWGFINNQGKWL